MGKKAELILSQMLRARRVRRESIDRVMDAIKNAPGEDLAYLDLEYRQDLLAYIGGMQDTMEALEQEIEEANAATGEDRLSELQTENLELKDDVSNLSYLLENAELWLGIIGTLNNDFYNIISHRRPIGTDTWLWVQREHDEKALKVGYHEGDEKPFRLLVGGYILNTFATSEEAEKALKDLNLF